MPTEGGTAGSGAESTGPAGMPLILLCRTRPSSKHYYVRQLRDMKGSMSVSVMDPLQLNYYGRLCGWAPARAHARTGRAAMISGYLGSDEDFDHAIADFAITCADQNEQDYKRLLEAVSAARVLATVDR